MQSCRGHRRSRARAFFATGLRLVVSVALLVWLLGRVNVQQLLAVLSESTWWLIVLSTLILAARYVVGALRWQTILMTQGEKVPVAQLVRWYLVGTFFNMFLPTALGGDVVRAYAVGKNTGGMINATVSVVLERLIGISGMILLAVPSLAFIPAGHSDPRIYWGVLGIGCCFSVVLLVIFHPAFCRLAVATLCRLRLDNMADRIEEGHVAMRELSTNGRTLITAALLTLLFHLIGVYCVYLVGLALSIHITLWYYCAAVPIIWLVTMLPVSINGIGVREGAFVLFFSVAGATTSQCLMLSLVCFAQLLILGMVGGLVYAVEIVIVLHVAKG